MTVTSMIPFDGAKLRRDLKAQGVSQAKASKAIGMSDSFLSDRIRHRQIAARKLRLLCDTYHLDYQSYLIPDPAPAPAQEPEPSLSFDAAPLSPLDTEAIARQLGEISSKLDKLTEVLKTRHPVFTPVEECVLLLQALTKFGACTYRTFEDEAKKCGLNEDTMTMALNLTGYRVFVGNNVKQIARK